MIALRTGHLDGKDSVYSENGRPILLPNEFLMREVEGDTLGVSEGSSVWNMKTLFGYTAEKGTLFVTSRRLLFLQKPDPMLAAKYDAYPYGMADAIAKGYRAHELKKAKALEYCEIDFDEIEGFEVKKRTYGVLYLRSDPKVTRKAILYIRRKEDDKFRVLKDLLSKRLPVVRAEDRKGNLLLGAKYPFLGRHKKPLSQ